MTASFVLQACDQFTRNFLTKIGKTVPEDDGVPTDEYTEHRTAVSLLFMSSKVNITSRQSTRQVSW